ncbi:MAG: tRNA-uridine aminocarboxypropyltransferase [Endozoicomonas sp.]
MARAECPKCKRPPVSCYCQDLGEETACMDLLILQHPKETRHPLNSARIAQLGIRNCEILVGEDFIENNRLQDILNERKTCLLFPSPEAQSTGEYLDENGKPDLCIVIDGTWRKARKIYYLNPALQDLPAISLRDTGRSEYKIRKSPSDKALSTIEAAVALLREVGNNKQAHQQCLDAFEKMISLQIDAMGRDVYKNNYRSRAPD